MSLLCNIVVVYICMYIYIILKNNKKMLNKKKTFFQVAVLKELVDGTLGRDFIIAKNPSIWRWFIKKVHEDVFKRLVLSCPMNWDVCKRACLIGAFIQHVTHFCVGVFIGVFFRWRSAKLHSHLLFLLETYYVHKK